MGFGKFKRNTFIGPMKNNAVLVNRRTIYLREEGTDSTPCNLLTLW